MENTGAKTQDLGAFSIFTKYDLKHVFTESSGIGGYIGIFITLTAETDYIPSELSDDIGSFVASSGKFVGDRKVVRAIFGDDAADGPVICQGDEDLPDVRKYAIGGGEVYAISGDIECALDYRLGCHYARFWRECFGLEQPSQAHSDSAVTLIYTGRGVEG